MLEIYPISCLGANLPLVRNSSDKYLQLKKSRDTYESRDSYPLREREDVLVGLYRSVNADCRCPFLAILFKGPGH